MRKRILAFLLMLSFLLPGCPPSAQAQEPAYQSAVYQLDAAGSSVTVHWYGQDVAQVVVEAYDDSGATLLQRQRTAVAASGQGNHDTVCAFSAPIPFGSGFVVKNDVLLIRETPSLNVQATSSGSVYSYSLTGVDATLGASISGLNPGDVVCIADEHTGLFYGIKADSAQVNGSRATLTSHTKALSLEEYSDASLLKEQRYSYAKDFSFNNPYFAISGRLDITLRIGFSHKGGTVYFSFIIDYRSSNTNLTLKSPSFGKSLPLITVPLAGIPFIADVEFTVNLELSVAGTGSVVLTLSGCLGVQISASIESGIDFNNASSSPQVTFDGLSLDGEVFIGISAGPQLSVIKLVTAGLKLAAGCVISGRLNSVAYRDNRQKWHACDGFQCLTGDFKFRVYGSAGISIAFISKSIDWNFYVSPAFAEWYYSFPFRDGGMTACPHEGYRLKVTVLDGYGKPVNGANVSYSPVPAHYELQSFGTTGTPGWLNLYIPLTATGTPGQLSPTNVQITAECEDARGHHFLKEVAFQEAGYLPDTRVLK